jgi:hypothetical protein
MGDLDSTPGRCTKSTAADIEFGDEYQKAS